MAQQGRGGTGESYGRYAFYVRIFDVIGLSAEIWGFVSRRKDTWQQSMVFKARQRPLQPCQERLKRFLSYSSYANTCHEHHRCEHGFREALDLGHPARPRLLFIRIACNERIRFTSLAVYAWT